MMDPNKADILLFSYGTLQDKVVQMANFGRHLLGRADSLAGYALVSIAIADPAVVALSGKSQHLIAKRGLAGDRVTGMVFAITPEELVAADRYEVAEYKRVLVTLLSGVEAWVYVGAAVEDAVQPLRARLSAELRTAMKARDMSAIDTLRCLLGVLDNAGAQDLNTVPVTELSGEVPRKLLTRNELLALLRVEVTSRRTAVMEYERAGRHQDAERVRAQVILIEHYVAL